MSNVACSLADKTEKMLKCMTPLIRATLAYLLRDEKVPEGWWTREPEDVIVGVTITSDGFVLLSTGEVNDFRTLLAGDSNSINLLMKGHKAAAKLTQEEFYYMKELVRSRVTDHRAAMIEEVMN